MVVNWVFLKKFLLGSGDGVALLWLSFGLRLCSSTMSGLRGQRFFSTGPSV